MIRTLKQNEFQHVLNLIQQEFGELSGYDETCPVEYLVYEKDKQIIGILCYSILIDRMEVNYIMVVGEERKNGIATSLLTELEQIAHAKKLINITLEVEKENIPALSLYHKMGYNIVTERKGYYHGKDGVLMLKDLVV